MVTPLASAKICYPGWGGGPDGKGGELAAASARPLSKLSRFPGKPAVIDEGVKQAKAGPGLVSGVAKVHGATGKTVNANSRIVNATMAANPTRAQIYLTMGPSCK